MRCHPIRMYEAIHRARRWLAAVARGRAGDLCGSEALVVLGKEAAVAGLAPTKFEQVYQALQARIEAGEYAPGKRLSYRELTHDLNASEMPVREAIHRLAAEGRLVYTPRHGVVVAEVTFEETCALLLPLAVLEGAITRLAARRVSRETHERLAATIAEQHA